MNFAQKIYELRTKYGYSQEQLAEKLNVSRQAISKWEVGATLPETDTVILLSELFNVSIDYLLKDSIQSISNENLDRMVIRFLASSKEMNRISSDLIDILEDGKVDEFEQPRMQEIMEMLDQITHTIHELKAKMGQ